MDLRCDLNRISLASMPTITSRYSIIKATPTLEVNSKLLLAAFAEIEMLFGRLNSRSPRSKIKLPANGAFNLKLTRKRPGSAENTWTSRRLRYADLTNQSCSESGLLEFVKLWDSTLEIRFVRSPLTNTCKNVGRCSSARVIVCVILIWLKLCVAKKRRWLATTTARALEEVRFWFHTLLYLSIQNFLRQDVAPIPGCHRIIKPALSPILYKYGTNIIINLLNQ